jgi:DNA-binding NarL/FixJ family response regulator
MKVGIVDDHELVREGLAALLIANSQTKPSFDVVYSGGVVTEAINAQPEIALLDIDLGPNSDPVDRNVELLTNAGIPTLLMSANDDAHAIRSGILKGALGFVPKRVSYSDLTEALATAIEGEMYLSVDLAAILNSAREKPELSPRETDALKLYATGLTLNAVARRMEISPHTAKEYLDRVRAKYAHLGREARTRTELYAAARDDGFLESDFS